MRALSRVSEGAVVLLLGRGGAVDWAVAVGIAVGAVLVSWAVLIVLARRLPPGLARELAAFLPACVGLARALRRDPAVPRRAKLALLVGVVWLVSPIDLVPELVPVIGPIDDIVVIALVLRYAARKIPVERLVEAWPGDDPRLLLRLTGHGPAR